MLIGAEEARWHTKNGIDGIKRDQIKEARARAYAAEHDGDDYEEAFRKALKEMGVLHADNSNVQNARRT